MIDIVGRLLAPISTDIELTKRWQPDGSCYGPYDPLRLEAAAEITALRARAEAAEKERDELRDRLEIGPHGEDAIDVAESAMDHLRNRAEAAEASLAKAVEVIRPFITDWADENGWTDSACQKDRIVDWFGPSDFHKAAEFIKEIEGNG